MTFSNKLITGLAIFGILFVIGLFVFFANFRRELIPPGYVGIEIDLLGGNRGVSNIRESGYVTFNPSRTQIVLFPTRTQRYVWTKATDEGASKDEAIEITSGRDQQVVSLDLGFAFHITDPAKVYSKYRMDPDALLNTVIRDYVRGSFNSASGSYSAFDMVGAQRARFIAEAQKLVEAKLKADSISLDNFQVIKIRPPDSIVKQINQAAQSRQQVQLAQADLQKTRAEKETERVSAEAEAKVNAAKAAGEAKVTRLEADANAYAKVKGAEAEATALRLKKEAEAAGQLKQRAAITPELVKYTEAQAKLEIAKRWNGVLPPTIGGGNSSTILDARDVAAIMEITAGVKAPQDAGSDSVQK